MTPEERTAILDALLRLGRRDADLVPPLTSFLPLAAHRYALWPDTVVVLGGRGAGKTALFRLVNDARTSARLRAFFEDDRIPEATWIDAFSQGSMQHPEVGLLEGVASAAGDLALRAFWMTHLLRRVHEEVPGLVPLPPALQQVLGAPVADLPAWLPTAEANLGAVSATLDAAERALVASDRSVVATYDHLDRIGQFEPGVRRRYVSTLLALWLSLSNRYTKLRGKIFLRDDLFDAGELGFADATKLRPRSQTITWDHAALYRVVVRYLAGESEALRAWLAEVPGLELRDRGEFGWMPGEMSDHVQHDFIGRLAGKVIGKGVLKGPTHLWIVNRLQDANRRVTPRAMLWFFEFAGEAARARTPGRGKAPLTSDDLVAAVRRVSQERVTEIREEYPVAARLENLRGMTIPLDREDAIKKLGMPRKGERDGIPPRGDIILSEMLHLGVLRETEEGKLDVPDIYRYSFDIAPDYATAWAEFLEDGAPEAREHFVRELPRLGEMLRPLLKRSFWGEGESDVSRKDFPAARVKLERAIDVVRNTGDLRVQSELWQRLAWISGQQGQQEQATQELKRGVEAAHRAGSKREEADCHWWLGSVHLDRREFELAAAALTRALDLYEEIQSHDGVSASRNLKGTLERVRGSVKNAATQYKLALKAAQESSGRSVWEGNAFHSLAQLPISDPTAALRLIAVGAVAQGETADPDLGWLAAERTQRAKQLGYTEAEEQALLREASAEYARDRGWSVVRAAFPDDDPRAD